MNVLGGEGKPWGAGKRSLERQKSTPCHLQIDSLLCLQKDLESFTEKVLPANPPEQTQALLWWRESPFALLLIAWVARQSRAQWKEVIHPQFLSPVSLAHPPGEKKGSRKWTFQAMDELCNLSECWVLHSPVPFTRWSTRGRQGIAPGLRQFLLRRWTRLQEWEVLPGRAGRRAAGGPGGGDGVLLMAFRSQAFRWAVWCPAGSITQRGGVFVDSLQW